MEIKQAKAELKGYARMKLRVKRLTEQEQEIQEQISSAGGQRLTGLPAPPAGKKTDLSDCMVLLEEIEHKRAAAIHKMAVTETRIADMEDDRLAELVRLRYKKEMCWCEVAQELHISEAHAKKLHSKALMEYSGKLQKHDTK